MKFIYDYELCALAFLIIIMVFYFIRKRLGSITNKMYSLFLFAAFFDIILDIVASILLEQGADIPIWVDKIINTAFYCCQITIVYFGYLYTLAISNKLNKQYKKLAIITSIPCIAYIILCIVNFATNWLFTIDSYYNYIYGPLHIMTYAASLLYLLLIVIVVFLNRKSLASVQILAMTIMCTTSTVFAFIQFMVSNYLVTGVANVIAAFFMFLALQNPADNIDVLTGCFNETAFNQFYNKSFANKEKFIYIAINVTGLKIYNYTFGVENCDKLIRSIGIYLRGINERLSIFRISGSTFGVILHSEAELEAFLQKYNNRFKRPWTICEVEVKLHSWIVRIDVPKYAENIETLLYNMDYCLNMPGLNANIDKYFAINDELYDKIRKNATFDDAILKAIENESFSIVYQPIFSVEKQRFCALEALVRLNDDTIGQIQPSVFLPIAEKNGHIIKIGSIVLNRVCEFIEKIDIQRLGFDYISVNLSAPECMQDDLANQIYSIFDSYIIDPKSIHFDISETAAANAIEHLRVSMYRLKKSGCEFALDDYGTGYSNMSGITQLPFNMIKIDRSLIKKEGESERAKAVMLNMMDMFKGLGLQILAEGIEDAQMADYVQKLGANYIQGFYYASMYDEKQLLETFGDGKEVESND